MLNTFVLAVVQSIAEFLPISSSAHLILMPRFFGWADQGMLMDIALHVGTLFSVLIYFRQDVRTMFFGTLDLLMRRFNTPAVKLVLLLLTAVVPVLFIGAIGHSYIETNFRAPRLIACTMIIGGILLYVADKYGSKSIDIGTMTYKKAFFIGLAQVLALIPGVSRSGITMTAARAMGVNREESARFSMLLSIPTIAAAGAAGFWDFFTKGEALQSGNLIGFGILIAFVGGLGAIWFLMNWLKKSSFAIFAIYRIILGIVLFCLF